MKNKAAEDPDTALSCKASKKCVAILGLEPFQKGRLTIVILGASGDLAKKKTYPAIFDLFRHKFLPSHVSIVGYARSAKTTEEFRGYLRPWLEKQEKNQSLIDAFLACNTYFTGNYGSVEDFARLDTFIKEQEAAVTTCKDTSINNRIFYFAIPPDAFLASARSIRASSTSSSGFTRLIVEKPFGHDLESANQLVSDLGGVFDEDHIYRIDHYLGKEIVQNLMMFRFGNIWLEPLWNNRFIGSVRITFAEDFGTEGRGGYFTKYGIIRDVLQNHLIQVLSIVAMEPPPRLQGEGASNFIRDSKNNVLRSISPIDPNEVVIGQYIGSDGKPGYLDDDSIQGDDKERAKFCPTFAQCVLRINTPRWHGVPFIMKAGKALSKKKVEIRVQFKEAPAGAFMFDGEHMPRNELVMRLQPEEIVYMKVNVKTPGLENAPLQTELDLSYKQRFAGVYNPDAYTRLILEALRGNQENFVRSDELLNSWKLFTPLLEQLSTVVPLPYKYNSRGPAEADQMAQKVGYVRQDGFRWHDPTKNWLKRTATDG